MKEVVKKTTFKIWHPNDPSPKTEHDACGKKKHDNHLTFFRNTVLSGFCFLSRDLPYSKQKKKKITLKFQGENTISSDKQKRNPDKTHVNAMHANMHAHGNAVFTQNISL